MTSPPPLGRRDRRLALLLALIALLVYNANLRSIAEGDSYPARFIPFALWGHGTVYLDPVLDLTIQGRPYPYWVRDTVDGQKASLYAVATPLLVAPLYLPAVAWLRLHGWTEARVNLVAYVMEKIAASIVASLAVGWMYLLLRRRVERRHAVLLAVLFAFGTASWSISSQALWQHGPAELFMVAALWFLTGEQTSWHTFAAGLATGLVAANRPPDLTLALAFGAAALFHARLPRSRIALFAAGGAIPVVLTVAYNLITFGRLFGGYGQAGVVSRGFFANPPLEGIAGLLVSPGRGLFVFSPFLLFILLFYRRALRDRPNRALTLALTGGFLLLLLVYAGVDFRQGGSYGPRFLTDAVPILVWMLAPVLPSLDTGPRAAFLAAGAFSVWVQAVGAFQYNGVSNLKLFEIRKGPGATRNSWSPRHAPFFVEARNPRQPADLFRALQRLGDPHPPPSIAAPPASDFYTVPPCRLFDTRKGGPPPEPLGGTPRAFQIAGAGCSIPPSAVAVAGNLTVLGQGGEGVLRVRPDDRLGWIEVAFAPGVPRSAHAILPLSPEGSLSLLIDGARSTSAHVQLDVTGYFAAGFPKR